MQVEKGEKVNLKGLGGRTAKREKKKSTKHT